MKDFDIRANSYLNLMKENQSLNEFIGSAVQELEKVFIEEEIEAVVVHGDTGSTLAASLASYNLRLPVFHVEAGLRSHDLNNPFPEEMNRKLVSQLASFHFAPTERAVENLVTEGIKKEKVFQVGNTIVDVVTEVIKNHAQEITNRHEKFLEIGHRNNVLITVHRRENHKYISTLSNVLMQLSSAFPDTGFWIPVHPNPNVKVHLDFLKGKHKNLHVIEPLEYLDFLALAQISDFIVTDSGGVQEEATVLGKFCFVLRDFTERPELIEAGLGRLLRFEKEEVISAVSESLGTPAIIKEFKSPFGDGQTSKRIIEILKIELA